MFTIGDEKFLKELVHDSVHRLAEELERHLLRRLVNALMAERISDDDRRLLEALNRRSERIARKLERLDAKTPRK